MPDGSLKSVGDQQYGSWAEAVCPLSADEKLRIRCVAGISYIPEYGNVGYAIRPSARNRGLGKKLLLSLIGESKEIGVDRVLLTIRNHNAPSIHVALANGGKKEKITADKHYIWIEP